VGLGPGGSAWIMSLSKVTLEIITIGDVYFMPEQTRILTGQAQHIGTRHSQQDSFGFANPDDREFVAHAGFLAVVCDGMGGMEHGDAAGRTAVDAFLEAYRSKTSEESIPVALERSARTANQAVVSLAVQLGMVENMGTTLVAASVIPGAFYYISIGDSAIYLVNHGQAQMINHPHVFGNLLQKAVESGIMSREDADRHPERESLTSFVGTQKLEEIDHNFEPCALPEGATILLASDGMFKTLEPREMMECLKGDPQGWPEALVARTLAKQYESQDNVTVLSVAFDSGARSIPPMVDGEKTARLPTSDPTPVERRSLTMMIAFVVLMLIAAVAAAGLRWHARHR
jgi:serine/threonine protein phosphatase PrpC